MMKDMFGSIKAGKAIDAPRVKEAVTSMTDSVVRNPDTMMLLAKMKESGEHTLDRAFGVSIYMITFGRFLHLPREQLDLLGTLGLLQDVGKVRLPPDLLDKTDPLTEVELKVCKSHVRHSVAILRETVGLPPGLPELAALHHERFDGSGYRGASRAGRSGSSAASRPSSTVSTRSRTRALTARRCPPPTRSPCSTTGATSTSTVPS
jgi:HD-GYP domain-containing protein (c-di-GMP phosphodiesterase class II)